MWRCCPVGVLASRRLHVSSDHQSEKLLLLVVRAMPSGMLRPPRQLVKPGHAVVIVLMRTAA